MGVTGLAGLAGSIISPLPPGGDTLADPLPLPWAVAIVVPPISIIATSNTDPAAPFSASNFQIIQNPLFAESILSGFRPFSRISPVINLLGDEAARSIPTR